jgi:hypothetical protein
LFSESSLQRNLCTDEYFHAVSNLVITAFSLPLRIAAVEKLKKSQSLMVRFDLPFCRAEVFPRLKNRTQHIIYGTRKAVIFDEFAGASVPIPSKQFALVSCPVKQANFQKFSV